MVKKLIATINATHSGFVNGNNTWYLEEDMSNAVDTWTTPFNKPVLIHHEMKKDPIGRVLSAKYLPMKNSKGKNAPKGYIQLECEITDPDAISKIQDKRYNTVSISTDARSASCSVCGQDIANDGLCEHVRGKKYDGKKCFWYLGGLKYKEVSFVNAPADEYAETIKLEEKEVSMVVQDSNQEPAFNIVDEAGGKLLAEDTECWDSYTDEDLALAYWLMVEMDNEMSVEDKTLSAKTRKSMKPSTFCGPNKSFPIPDCAHVTAARRLISRYKGPGDKTKILNCVERKAKAMGCDSKTTKDNKGDMMVFSLEDALARDDVRSHIDSQIKDAVKEYTAKLSGFTALSEKANKLEADLSARDQELSSQKELTKTLEDSLTQAKTEIHKTYVDRVFDLRKSLSKKDVMLLKDAQEVEAYKADLSKRTDESLKDAIADLSKETIVEVKTTDLLQSTPDETVTATSEDSVQAPAVIAAPAASRRDKVKAIIFKD